MAHPQWETYSDLYERGIGDSGDDLHQTLLDPLIFSLLGNAENKRVLDAGCGNGYLIKKLAPRVKSITGIDGSVKLLAHARLRTNNFSNVTLLSADLEKKLPFQNGSFDIVIANMVLQYLPYLNTFVSEVVTILASNGILIVTIDHPGHQLFIRVQELAGKKNSKFLDSASYFSVGLRKKKSLWNKAILEYYHRPLMEYINPFTDCFHLSKIIESTDDGECPRICGFKWRKF